MGRYDSSEQIAVGRIFAFHLFYIQINFICSCRTTTHRIFVAQFTRKQDEHGQPSAYAGEPALFPILARPSFETIEQAQSPHDMPASLAIMDKPASFSSLSDFDVCPRIELPAQWTWEAPGGPGPLDPLLREWLHHISSVSGL